MMIELKPCPFCGAPVTMSYSSRDKTFKIYHSVNDNSYCNIIEPIMLEAVSLTDAAKAWNRRCEL